MSSGDLPIATWVRERPEEANRVRCSFGPQSLWCRVDTIQLPDDDLRHVRLPKEDNPVGIETNGEVVECHVEHVGVHFPGIPDRGQGVKIGDEVKALVRDLTLHVASHGAKVVPEVEPARGLDPRQIAHKSYVYLRVVILSCATKSSQVRSGPTAFNPPNTLCLEH